MVKKQNLYVIAVILIIVGLALGLGLGFGLKSESKKYPPGPSPGKQSLYFEGYKEEPDEVKEYPHYCAIVLDKLDMIKIDIL